MSIKLTYILLVCINIISCQNVCQQPMSSGTICSDSNARDKISQKFYFNGATGQCTSMVYAGCGGNGNRFDTMKDCQSRCMSDKTAVVTNTMNCSKNEIWDECNAKCQKTCNNIIAMPCTMICAPGCICAPGYVRSSPNGECILQSQCSNVQTNTCGSNEVWDECGTSCPETCSKTLMLCTADCKIGCRCKDGFVLNNGICVDRSQCQSTPKECNSNDDCPSGQICPLLFCFVPPCPKYCTKARSDPIPIDATMWPGCAAMMCSANSRCVEDANGRARCVPINEVDIRPPMVDPPKPIGCEMMLCAPNTQCITDENGQSHCRAIAVVDPAPIGSCPANEEWDNCGSACPETCYGAAPFCTMQCVIGCRCKAGYVRNNNVCIPKSECSNAKRKECNTSADCQPGQSCMSVECFRAPCPKFCWTRRAMISPVAPTLDQ